MGKRGKKHGKGGGGGQRGERQTWQEVEKSNEKYERYYNETGIIPDEEKEAFWAALRRDLPNSFRFTGSRGHALAVQQRLKDFYIPEITSITYEGNFVEPPRPIPWYPDQLAWSMTTPKNVIRRFAPFASFQKFLVSETEVGNISRQEVVSMIPPLLMDIRPGMTVLDMCAAPGSKSAQLMEMLLAGEEERMKAVAERVKNGADPSDLLADGLEDDGRSTGLLIANDSDYKRAHMLVHQMKRLNSPNLIVTNHDATMYPSIKLPSPPSEPGKPPKHQYLKFDRILADVPCSGDGTARKNRNVWTDWVPGNALGLHATQARILVRALQMLKVGGRVVYSTCSMNPIENEAVVASAIDRCGGLSNVEIVDCSDKLPGLKRVPGLRSWKVMDREGRIWSSWKEVQEYRQNNGIEGLGRLAEGMFAPDADLPLERCMRVYPHLQDTGGFFIAVLEKKSEIRAKPEDSSKTIPKASVAAVVEELDKRNGTEAPLEKIDALDSMVEGVKDDGKNETVAESTHRPPYARTLNTEPSSGKRSPDHLEDKQPAKRTKVEDGTEAVVENRPVHYPPPPLKTEGVDETTGESQPEKPQPPPAQPQPPQKKKPGQPVEEPFKFIDPNLEELQQIFSFYNISDRFPRDRFMVRNAQGYLSKTIYYTTALARDILVENEGRGIKFVHSGVKMFVKQDAQRPNVCRWRIQTDGLQIIESWVGPERAITLYKKDTLRKLLVEMFAKADGDGWKQLGEIGERARDMSMGCCVLRIEPSDAEDGFRERMVLPLWRSLHSINLMLPKEDRRALLLRLYNDETPLVNTTQKRENAANASTLEAPVDETTPPDNADADVDPDIPSAEVEREVPPPAAKTEEDLIKNENVALGQEEQDRTAKRETWQRAGDEEDRFNTTL